MDNATYSDCDFLDMAPRSIAGSAPVCCLLLQRRGVGKHLKNGVINPKEHSLSYKLRKKFKYEIILLSVKI